MDEEAIRMRCLELAHAMAGNNPEKVVHIGNQFADAVLRLDRNELKPEPPLGGRVGSEHPSNWPYGHIEEERVFIAGEDPAKPDRSHGVPRGEFIRPGNDVYRVGRNEIFGRCVARCDGGAMIEVQAPALGEPRRQLWHVSRLRRVEELPF